MYFFLHNTLWYITITVWTWISPNGPRMKTYPTDIFRMFPWRLDFFSESNSYLCSLIYIYVYLYLIYTDVLLCVNLRGSANKDILFYFIIYLSSYPIRKSQSCVTAPSNQSIKKQFKSGRKSFLLYEFL